MRKNVIVMCEKYVPSGLASRCDMVERKADVQCGHRGDGLSAGKVN